MVSKAQKRAPRARTHGEVDPEVKFRVVQSEPVLKPILAERAGELMGMFFVVLGVLLSLSVYVSVVGPVGLGSTPRCAGQWASGDTYYPWCASGSAWRYSSG